jgi:hypothetical protein
MFKQEEHEQSANSTLSFSIGAALNTEIKFIANCQIRVKVKKKEDPFRQVIICLGKDEIYFFDEELKMVKFKFSYENVIDVIIEKLNLSSVMINLEDVELKGNKIPHIYFTIPDKDQFLSIFKCYFCIYFADKYSLIKDLFIREQQLITFENDSTGIDKYKNIFHSPPENYKVVKFKNYFLFIPPEFKNEVESESPYHFNFLITNPFYTKIDNKDSKIMEEIKTSEKKGNDNHSFYDSDAEKLNLKDKKSNSSSKNISAHTPRMEEQHYLKCKFMFKIKSEKDISILSINKEYSQLELFTFSEFLRYVHNTYHTTARLVISKDCFYIKKYNIGEDFSNWSGWRIEALMTHPVQKKLVFINIRRKFIPPFFESFCDFTFLCEVDLSLFNNDQLIKFKDKEIFELNKLIETVIDSQFPEKVLNYRDFIPILKTKFDSLAIDHDSLMFFTETLKIYGPQTYVLGVKFILKMMECLVSDNILEEMQLQIKKDESLLAQIKNFRNFFTYFQNKILKFLNSDNKFANIPNIPKDIT